MFIPVPLGLTVVQLQQIDWGSQPRPTQCLVSGKLNLFVLMPTAIVANRWGKRSFLPTSTLNANLQNIFHKAILSQRWGEICVFVSFCKKIVCQNSFICACVPVESWLPSRHPSDFQGSHKSLEPSHIWCMVAGITFGTHSYSQQSRPTSSSECFTINVPCCCSWPFCVVSKLMCWM